jgi:hypothetical protein
MEHADRDADEHTPGDTKPARRFRSEPVTGLIGFPTRLFRRSKRREPKPHRRRRLVVTLVGVGVVLVAATLVVRNLVADEPRHINVVNTTASTEVPQADGQGLAVYATDRASDTFWVAHPADTEPVLRVEFGRRVTIDRVIVWNGAGGHFSDFNRAESLDIEFGSSVTDVTLDDTPDPVEYDVDVVGVTSVDVHIRSQFTASQPGAGVALSEIEFVDLD